MVPARAGARWGIAAVARERAASGAHKYSGISEGIWDRSAVARERARGCPGARCVGSAQI